MHILAAPAPPGECGQDFRRGVSSSGSQSVNVVYTQRDAKATLALCLIGWRP